MVGILYTLQCIRKVAARIKTGYDNGDNSGHLKRITSLSMKETATQFFY